MKLSSLHIYPVKSCAGLSLQQASMEPEGISGDRRWMVTDLGGQFLTQRTHPALARLSAHITDTGLTLSLDGDLMQVEHPTSPRLDVVVWRDSVNAALSDPATNRWLSAKLGTGCNLSIWMRRRGG